MQARAYIKDGLWVAEVAGGKVFPFGDQWPFSCDLAVGRDENRRVEVKVKPARYTGTMFAYFIKFLGY